MKHIYLLLLILFPALVFSQQAQVKGKVVDGKDNLPVPGATVMLLLKSDTSQVKGTITDFGGNFIFQDIKHGEYLIRTSFVGYGREENILKINQNIFNAGTVKIKQSSTLLKDVEIKEMQVRVEQKGDTTQYNADAYKTNPDASAEDLVKKMPGIIIENGSIKAQGEDVREVFVDGKPFFGDDPNAALKNLPAEIIDNVQVYDRMSDQARFTGVEDGNTSKAINIVTKPGKNNGQFGRTYAGYGSDDRYNAGVTMNFFNGDRRFTILGITNNINQQNFSEEDILGATGGGGRGPRGGGWRRRSPEMENLMVNQQGGIARTNALGFNYSDSWGKKITVTGSYFYNNTKNDQITYLTRTFFTARDSGLIYNEDDISGSINTNHRLNMRLEYNIDSSNSILVTPRISLQTNNRNSSVNGIFLEEGIVPESRTFNQLINSTTGYNIANGILYRHKFRKEKRTFSANLDVEAKQNDFLRNQYSLNDYFLLDEQTIIDQYSNQYSDGLSTSANLVFTEPLNEHAVVQLNYTPSFTQSSSIRQTWNIDPFNQEYTLLDTLLSNDFDNNFLSNRVGTTYMLNKKKLRITAGVNYQNAVLTGVQAFPDDFRVERTFNNILPEAMFHYNFSETTSYRLRYRTNTMAPSVAQLQNVVNNSNPLMLSTGNPDLRQSYSHTIFTRFGKTDVKKGKSFFVYLFGNYMQDYITNETIIPTRDTTLADGTTLTRGMQLTRPVNLDGYYNGRSSLHWGLPLTFIKSNLNLSTGVTLSRSPGLINNQVNFANNYGLNSGFNLGSNISEKIDFHISYNANYSIVKNTLQRQSDNNFFIQNSSAKLNWMFGKAFVFNPNINYIIYSGLAESFNQEFLLLNASLGYKFLKNRSLEVRATVFDLLGQNVSINRNVTETFIEDMQTNVLSRYIMLTVTYNLRNFKGNAPARVR